MKRPALALFAPLALAACATAIDGPFRGPLVAEGNPVAIGRSVELADLIVTPMRVTEDSRCPMNARCVWAGRLVVETRIDGAGWRETLAMTLGETEMVRGYRLMLASGNPTRMTGDAAIAPEDYRFTYEGGSTGIVP